MLRYEKGDLFDFRHQAYAHGVNTLGKMSAGIAVEFRKRYQEMYHQYRKLCLKSKLTLGDVYYWQSDEELPSVFNLVTQSSLKYAEPAALLDSFEKMYIMAKQKDIQDIAMPKIGMGYGKVDENIFLQAVYPFIRDSKVWVTIYEI